MYKIGSFFYQLEAGIGEKGFRDISEAFTVAHESGIEGIDFNAREITDNTPALLRETGMFAASVHGVVALDCDTDAGIENSVKLMKEKLDQAVFVGSPYFMIVPDPHKTEYRTTPPEGWLDRHFDACHYLFKEVCEYAKGKPIIPTVEDYSLQGYPFSTFEDIDYLFRENPNLMFTYDSGNFELAGVDMIEAAKRYASRTVYCHMKDLRVSGNPDHILRRGKYYDSCDLGAGYLDNKLATKIIKDGGFTDGTITIEINTRNGECFDRTVRSVTWLKNMLSEI